VTDMKKHSLKLMFCFLMCLMILSACGQNPDSVQMILPDSPEQNASEPSDMETDAVQTVQPDHQEEVSDGKETPIVESDATRYGEIREKLANFVIVDEVKKEDYPQVFEVNGKYGFKDADQNIIVEPVYDRANAFRNGVASVRSDSTENGIIKYKWQYIAVNGDVYPYDQVNGFHYGVSKVQLGDAYGIINMAGTEILPVEYDNVQISYYMPDGETKESLCVYAKKDDKWYVVDMKNGELVSYVPYSDEEQDRYASVFDLKDHSIMIINNIPVIDGKSDVIGAQFPLNVLEGMEFRVYDPDGAFCGLFEAKLVDGMYEGEKCVVFPEFKIDDDEFLDNDSYYAFHLNDEGYEVLPVAEENQKYEEIIFAFLSGHSIDNTPIRIHSAYEGDFYGTGTTSAILAFADVYRDSDDPQPMREEWNRDYFISNRLGFVSAILIVPNVAEPEQYEMLSSYIWQNNDWDYITYEIKDVVETDETVSIIVKNNYYEYADYSVFELEKK